jgi:hypothetical protein
LKLSTVDSHLIEERVAGSGGLVIYRIFWLLDEDGDKRRCGGQRTERAAAQAPLVAEAAPEASHGEPPLSRRCSAGDRA